MSWPTAPTAAAGPRTRGTWRCPTCGRYHPVPPEADCECGDGAAVHSDKGKRPCSRTGCGCTRYRPDNGDG